MGVRFPGLVLWLLLALVGAPSLAVARPPAIDVQLLRPSLDPGVFGSMRTADVPVHLSVSAALRFDYSARPLQLSIAGDGAALGDAVGRRLDGHLLGAFGLFGRVELGFDLPYVAYATGATTDMVRRALDVTSVGGNLAGDVGLVGKVLLRPQSGVLPAVALGTDVRLPTGAPANMSGEPGVVVDGLLILSQRGAGAAWALNLGYRRRQEVARVLDIELGDELVYRFTLTYNVERRRVGIPSAIALELDGRSLAAHPFGLTGGSSARFASGLEGRIGYVRHLPVARGDLQLTAGVGAGVLPGYGTPLVRLLVGTSYQSVDASADGDGDGVPSRVDQCPSDAEDLDGFADQDGCPELDNDGDGILDEDDDCSTEPEDRDGIDDLDGCPDPEVPDTDSDGIYDTDDKCLKDAEDVDGFQDNDGCPDNDNDKDGLPDLNDVCPDAAEDKNAFQDDDGCPDGRKRARLVVVRRDEVRLLRPLRFAADDVKTLTGADTVFDAVAAALKGITDLRRATVGVCQDRPNARSRALAARRTQEIVNQLRDRGVDERRIVTRSPIWQRNRRGCVEIKIDRVQKRR